MVEENYKEMVESFKDKLIQPILDEWTKYYDATGKMSEQYIAIENRNLHRQYERMVEILGNKAAAWEWYVSQVNLQHAKELESHDSLADGIVAGWIRMEEAAEPLSKRISEIWQSGISDMESAWKDTFFDTINGEWDNYLDHVTNILTALRDMLNNMLYEMVKDWLKQTAVFKKISGMFGDKEDRAKKIMAETAATTKQNVVLGTQIGIVNTLTSSYWALAMAMAACNMGSGSKMIGGVDTGGIYGWGGLEQGFQHGGKIEELILGIGQRTGKRYSFGEHGVKEYVIPEKKADIMFQHGTKNDLILGRRHENTPQDIRKLSQLSPSIQVNAPQQSNQIEISVPVSVEGNNKLAGKIRSEVEALIKDIMQEEMR